MNMQTMNDDLTIRDILKVIFRHKWTIIVTLIFTLLAVYVGLLLKTPRYEAVVKMLVSAKKQVESTYYRDLVDYRQSDIALTQSEIVRSTPVLERTINALNLIDRPEDYEREFASSFKIIVMDGLKTVTNLVMDIYYFFKRRPPEDVYNREVEMIKAVNRLKDAVEVKAIKDTDLFEIKVQDFNQLAAAAIANVVSRSYVIFDLEQQLAELQLKFGPKHLAVTQLNDEVQRLIKNLSGEKISTVEAIGPASVKIIDQASVPLYEMGKPRIFYYGIAAILGLVLGVVLAFAFDYFDQSFKSPKDVEAALSTSLLGSIPHRRIWPVPMITHPDQPGKMAHAFRSLADRVYVLVKNTPVKTMLFIPTHSDKSIARIVANISQCLSKKNNFRVALVDVDFRRPSLHQCFLKLNERGLSDVLHKGVDLSAAIQPVHDHLSILSAGQATADPIADLGSSALSHTLTVLESEFDLVMLYCSDITRYKDVGLLTKTYKDAVLIINAGKTRKQTILSALAPMKNNGLNLLGAVLNKRDYVLPKVIYDRV